MRLETRLNTVPAADKEGSAPVAPAADAEYRAKVDKAAEAFEAQFIRQMLAQMRQATRTLSGPDGLFANPVNRDMLDIADTAVADALARSRQFGLADMIVRDLLGEPLKNAGGAVALNQQAHADGAALAAFAPPLRAPFHRTQESHTDAHDQ